MPADPFDHAARDVLIAAGYQVWMRDDGDHPEMWAVPLDQYAAASGMHPDTLAYLDSQGGD